MEYLLIIGTNTPRKRKSKTLKGELHFSGHTSPVKGKGLFITSSMLAAFHPLAEKVLKHSQSPSNDEVWLALNDATENITGQPFIKEKPVPLNVEWKRFLPEGKEGILYAEVGALRFAVDNWLSPSAEQTAPIDLDTPLLLLAPNIQIDFLPGLFAAYCLKARSAETSITPHLVKNKITRLHHSNTLLALCWAELWFALDHEIKARSCPYCGGIFIPSPFHPKAAHCQGSKCRRKHLVFQKGGKEKYLEWERKRKRKQRLKAKKNSLPAK